MPVRAFGRARLPTDPFDDKVKALLRGDVEHRPPAGCTSGRGGEHGADDLSGFVRRFFFSVDGEQAAPYCDDGFSGDEYGPSAGQSSLYGTVPTAAMIRHLVNPRAASPAEDRFRRDLEADAAAAAARFAGLRRNPVSFRWALMGSLRESGYNAGICNSKWESGEGGLVAGAHEYIDVLASPMAASPQRRYIIDVDFAGEFEIARPTEEYARLVAELPRVFVGRAEALQRLLGVLSDAARRSLRAREMHLPPWRRSRYMQAKWLGPYRRSGSSVAPSPPLSPSPAATSASHSAAPIGAGRGDVKCRFVGFDSSSTPLLAPAARTH